MRALLILVGSVGCRTPAASTTAQGTGCRAVAQATERFIAAAPAQEREAMLRFAVELIDLCQAPGLSPTTRKCVAAAPTAAAARDCPALALVPLRAAEPKVTVPGEEGGEVLYDFEDP